ncbi:hypothetical protein B0I35DRAFT_421830 [Stachybotrys elegans]|uniref:Letm1 RBD domain-containing protein n=1 Tax=Stachybotrys elegans TaxID=80388 RepID=A0A8K0SVP6_9HYPO|nr:hypothetical protein B0I35DRAFT_421830 [Stachybotrys elegans]
MEAMGSRIPWGYCAHGQFTRLAGLQTSGPPLRSIRISHPICRARLIHSDARDSQPPSTNTLLNPPASTRPPPLAVPHREAYPSAPQYWFELGKSYLRFYKTGLKNVLANRKLLKQKIEKTPKDDRPSVFQPYKVPRTFSRADWVLFWRVRHDMLRLPLFGLMLLVIGELTAVVVVFVDGVVPYTCRIPKQIFNSLAKSEHRRKIAFDEFEARYPHGVLNPRVTQAVARRHVLKSLNLPGALWDRLGFFPPGMWELKGRLRMAFLEGDDKNIIEDGGPLGMENEELRIACAERGINTLGKSESELRRWLGDWLRLTAAEDITERRQRMAVLLLTRPEEWPEHREFAVPEWTL